MLNQVAVITGSSRGIGAATARLMAAKGYSIVLNYQNSAGPAEALKQEILADNLSEEFDKTPSPDKIPSPDLKFLEDEFDS